MNKVNVTSNDPKWGVQAFATLFDITPRAVRFYEDKGLITPCRENGSRVFGPVEYVRFERILRAKRLGFTLDDIKEVLDVMDGTVRAHVELRRRRENFARVVKNLSRRREDIKKLTADMTDLCARIDTHLADVNPDDHGLAFAADYEAVFREHFADEHTSDINRNDDNA
ncbi:MAG: MerR family transcriptional regulator [Maricaulaceae bacterium]